MGRIARGYKTSEIRQMADHFSSNDWSDAKMNTGEKQFLAGQAIHDELCVECHEDAGRYQDKDIPRLAGTRPSYLPFQLADYQQEQIEMPQPDKMRERVRKLTRKDLDAVSRFYGQVGGEYQQQLANPPVGLQSDADLDSLLSD